jgi:hypothetical protein
MVAVLIAMGLAGAHTARSHQPSRASGSSVRLAVMVCSIAIFCLVAIVLTPSLAFAQEETPRSSIRWNVAKSVLFDPTTYTPAALSYESQRLDWESSQVLFRAGWLEANPRYTTSGLPNGAPISFAAGNAKIRREALTYLSQSVLNNVSTGLVERALGARYPEHRKLFHVMSWIERISFASSMSYLASVQHFRQAQRNRQMAQQDGY